MPRFSIADLLRLCIVLSLVFVFATLNPLLTVLFSPAIVGSLIAYSMYPTQGSLICGGLAGGFWTMVGGPSGFVLLSMFLHHFAPHVEYSQLLYASAVTVFSITGAFGGWLGSIVARAGDIHQQPELKRRSTQLNMQPDERQHIQSSDATAKKAD